ncbi:MAG: tyrosine-protein phosphatase [Polyangiaceae bacterium]
MHDFRSLRSLGLAFTLACATAGLSGCAAEASEGDGETLSAEDDLSSGDAPLANLVQVKPGLYRGGHPSTAGLKQLQQLGVKTIIDLEVGDFIEATPKAIKKEIEDAPKYGMKVIHKPMSAFEPALSGRFDKQMDTVIQELKNPANGTIYVHCRHGRDRTGLVIGLERVFVEGWQPGKAYGEMIDRGFRTFFIGLREYYERKTGWEND